MLLRLNDRGEAVREIQKKLGLVADGVFGPKTRDAVIAFQRKHGLTADGIVGPATLTKLNLTDAAIVLKKNQLTREDFVREANRLQCHPGMIEALALKEARGSAFLPDGRVKILFERHQFYKRLAIVRKPGQTALSQKALRDKVAAQHPQICSATRGGYIGNAGEYPRLDLARTFSDTAALESASFGLFQVMGFNAVAIGYESVQEFVRLMQQDIDQHLTALSRFILATPKALRGIRTQDYPLLAGAYNGPAYRENNYDTDLAKLFNQVKGKYA